jgi:hypothetical protein
MRLIGRPRAMTEPKAGPHDRGFRAWLERLRAAPRLVPPTLEPVAPPEETAFPITLVADKGLGEEVERHALEVVRGVARHASRPVLHGRVTLRVHADPAVERPAIAKAALDVGGRPVRAHVAAEQMVEAIDLLERRLRRNLEALEERDRAHRPETGAEPPGEWRHGSLPTARPDYFPRPPEERRLMRRKTFALAALAPAEAALELQLLDYDFHLFTNAETGEENVLHRGEDGKLELLQLASAPVLLPEDAIERLNLSGEPFVFFVDPQTRRGNVLYRRYDGHYGLIEPEPELRGGSMSSTTHGSPAIGLSEPELRHQLEEELVRAMRAEGEAPTIHAIAHSIARVLEKDHLRMADQLERAGVLVERAPEPRS